MTSSATDPTSLSNAELPAGADRVAGARHTVWRTGSDGTRVAETGLRLAGMHCAACAALIESALRRVPGVAEVRVSGASERATVCWRPQQTSLPALIDAVRGAGYDAVPEGAASERELRRREHRTALWRWFVAAFCAMQVMMLATPSYVVSAGELAPDLRQLLAWGQWVMSLPVMGLSAAPFFSGAWRSLRQRKLGMDVPVALGLLVTFVASSAATFHPAGVFGSEVYFDSLTMFVSFLLGARYLELRARHRAAEQLESALQLLPQAALRIDADGVPQSVDAALLERGDVVLVPLGHAFPADGVLSEGATAADESLLNGEPRPVDKTVGASVVAGSVNVVAPVKMRVERSGDQSTLHAVMALMREAATERPALARAADRWAAPFLWAVLLLAAGAAAVWSLWDPSRAVWVAVSVLIVTCPCALSLAVPSALLASAGALARRGVLLRRLDALEALARVDRVVLDKTGTLTEDTLGLRSVQRLPGTDAAGPDEAALQAQAAALARWSAHPLARALARATPQAEHAWRDVQELAGAGLQARDGNGRLWLLGSARHLGLDDTLQRTATASLWFGMPGRAALRLDFDEKLRDDALAAVRALREQGLHVTLLSGDRAARAHAVGAQLGVDAVIAQAAPAEKMRVVAQAQREGHRVWMVGDGVNDAPVLARADVSMAMGQGAALARAQADAVITREQLAELPLARAHALRTMAVVRQNLLWAAVYNALAVPLALAGWLPPWAAGLGMAASSLLVILNATRLAR
ncbi:MAG: cation-translocating P-type ATPase [Burkholderiaceae bacterium]